MDALAAKRARLAEVECELARLQAQHDLAMSTFKFDEANALQRQIAPPETERARLAADLPPLEPAPPEPTVGVVPILAERRRMKRRRYS